MTKERAEKEVAKNNLLDRIMIGVSAFGLLATATIGTLKYVKAPYPMNYVLAGAFVVFLVYLLVSPLYRK